MQGIEHRRDDRYLIGGAVEIDTPGKHYSGFITNTSMGGFLIELEGASPKFERGEEHCLMVFDIFSDQKNLFSGKVVRAGEREVAYQFDKPLDEMQRYNLEEWFQMLYDPGKCV